MSADGVTGRDGDGRLTADTHLGLTALVPARLARHGRLLRSLSDLLTLGACAALFGGATPAVATLVIALSLGLGTLVEPTRRLVLVRATLVSGAMAVYAIRQSFLGALDTQQITGVLLVLVVALLCAVIAEHRRGEADGAAAGGPARERRAASRRGLDFDRMLDQAAGRPFAVIAVAIDGLAQVRRLWGAGVAAAAEASVESALRDWAGTRSPLTRVDRDKFGLLLVNAGPAAVRACTDRLVELVEAASDTVRPSVSLGWAAGGDTFDEGERPAAVWAAARQAAEDARDLGGGLVVGAGDRRHVLQIERPGILARVVATQPLRAIHEPVVDLATGRVIAAEALARPVSMPAGGTVAELFIVAAEMGALGELEGACRRATLDGSEVLPATLPLHLNIAIAALAGDAGADAAHLAAMVVAAGRPPHGVVLDLTDAWRFDAATVAMVAAAYRAEGFRISIDGVGDVPSAAAMLASLVPDVIKLDHGTIGRTVLSIAGRDEVRDLVLRAHDLGVLTVGKAIETAAMADRVMALGITAGQGRYIVAGRPLAAPVAVPA
jgi:EAL domain-containing protein (putative c-di-GMP-specific phosphodiesterase class I)